MPLLHEPGVRASIETRLAKLRPDSRPVWGRMSIDQMLWHVNTALESTLGRVEMAKDRAPLPRSVMKFIVLNLPWPRNAPTNPGFVARSQYDFEAERARCRALIAEFTARPLEGAGEMHPMFGRMSGRDSSRLHAKHLDHHFRQFGV